MIRQSPGCRTRSWRPKFAVSQITAVRFDRRFVTKSGSFPVLRILCALILIRSALASDFELQLPRDWQVFQRQSVTNGTVRLQGIRAADTTVEWRVNGVSPRGALPSGWQTVAPVGVSNQFIADVTMPAGGWYQLEVRARRKGEILGSTTIEHVGVGEVFAVAGQSNSANHGEERQITRTGRVSAFDGIRWQLANDPQPGACGNGGSFLPPLGDALVEQFNVPIGFVPMGVGATSVREWLPRGTRFPNPPTITGNVAQLTTGEWESRGTLFTNFTTRLRSMGPHGFRAVLWHQGESDANQRDPTRTLSGEDYRKYLEQLIQESRGVIGWDAPWFVAQASYHTPEDPGSPEIRAAQLAVVTDGMALAGPDTDALVGELRDDHGRGVHFSGRGLREHGSQWVAKISAWLQQELDPAASTNSASKTKAGAPPRLVLPGAESFTVAGRPAFIFWPKESQRSQPQPWIFYAPTLPAYPDEAERWMHEQFLAAGIAVAGVDVGEAYGSPRSHAVFDALYRELTERRGFAAKPCLFGRSRGGLWVSSWALAHPERVAGIIGIYPVFDFRTYPGLTNAASAYGLTPAELDARSAEFNPIQRMRILAQARIPLALVHGDTDTVVPLPDNSASVARRYEEAGVGSRVQLIVLPGQGHSFFEGYFHSQELVDFAITRAREGTTN